MGFTYTDRNGNQRSSGPTVQAWDRETQKFVITSKWVWTYGRDVPQSRDSAAAINNRFVERGRNVGPFSVVGATPLYVGPSLVKKPTESASKTRIKPTIATFALNAGQTISSLGDSIPILFGKRTNASGGLVTVPDAVYQRMHSAGVYEWVRVAYVIAEGGKQLETPAERGVRLGRKTLDSLDDAYYSFGTTNGSTSNNDPTPAKINPQGNFQVVQSLTGADQYLTGTINQGEVRCFSQTFSNNEAFGFSGEEPDCDAGDSGNAPVTSITSVPLNTVKAFVSNTRSCEVTEIGFAVSLNATSPDKDAVAPPGSLWVTPNPQNQNHGNVLRIVSLAAVIANKFSRNERKDVNNKAKFDEALANFRKEVGEGTRYFLRLDPNSLVPVDGRILKSKNFLDSVGETFVSYTGENRNRNTSSATGYALPNPDPCKPPNFKAILSDPNNPKMAFDIYWRDATVAGNDWRLLTRKPLIVTTAEATTMFSNIKIQHPSLRAVQFKFEPITPDDFSENYMEVNSTLFDNEVSHTARSKGSFSIIYARNTSEIMVDGNDGYKLTFRGGSAEFFGETNLDDQTTNYAASISYINEIIQDSPKYPFMGIALLNLRAFKGMSSLGQLSIYYDNGAQIRLLETGADGTSNMFPELANYLLTTFPGGAGAVTSAAIDTQSFLKAIKFTRSKNLFFDGVIGEKSGAFEFIAEYAPYFLLNFGMVQGKYSFFIATEDSTTGTSTATASQKLTLDDIVPGSYRLEYATLQDREEAIVNVTYRLQGRYMLGEPRTVSVAPAAYSGSNIISFDLSDFCTTEDHAVTYAKFVLAQRLTQTHTVRFTTFLDRIDLAPGRLFTFDFTVTASTGKTYKNDNQYQIVSAFYRVDGLVDIEAVEAPTNLSSLVFGNTYKVVT